MDERHWWFASKLQDTFHFGGYDNPTVLEDFLSDPEVVDLINDFLAPGEPRKLFFYCDQPASDSSRTPSASRRLHATSELTSDVVSGGRVCLYVLRAETDKEVEPSQMEKELFCGELRHSVLSSLASLLSEAYAPLLHSQQNWGECSDVAVANFLQNFDKFSSALLQTASLSQTQEPLLQKPSPELRVEIQSWQGRGGVREEVVAECEGLVGEWVNSIDGLLLEAKDERMEDPHSSPLSELRKWRQRHYLLSSVVEQLKMKESRTILTVLVTSKSRVLKKWRNTDASLTDAFNNARDRVRYLEVLSPHLEALEFHPSLPSLLTTVLPALTSLVKQMEGLSRAYARSGYLGTLYTKISNALVRICQASLQSYCNKQDGQDNFWGILSEVVQSKSLPTSPQTEHPLLSQLSLCLQVASVFKDTLHHLKEALLQQQHVSFSTPAPSTGHSTTSLSGKKGSSTATIPPPGGAGRRRGSLEKRTLVSSLTSPASRTNIYGVALQDVDQIAAGTDEFSLRVKQVLDIVATLSQYRQLVGSLRGLPWVTGLWEVEGGERGGGSSEVDNERVTPSTEGLAVGKGQEQESGEGEHPLPPLREEEETSKEGGETEGNVPSCATSPSPSTSPADSIALRVQSCSSIMASSLCASCPRGVADVFSITGRTRAVFPTAFERYSTVLSALEKDICHYLMTVVPLATTSKRALEIIRRFDVVSARAALKEALQTCSLTAFRKYSTELEETQTICERNKGYPPVSKSLPPIAGAVSWCREMQRRVSEPMDTFRENSAIMQSVASLEVCKLHNRLSTSLLQYESSLLSGWRGAIESARTGLKAPLLVQEGGGKAGRVSIRVNCQQSLIEMMAESKTLSRMGIPLPEVVQNILSQELRVKHFRQQLQHVLDEFYSAFESMEPAVQTLLAPQSEAVVRSLYPGCTTLTWETLNIDAFLHHITTCVSRFKAIVARIHSILRQHVYSTLKEIAKSSLYDVELASSRVWSPHEFSDAMKTSLAAASSNLLRQVASIKRAVITVVTIASGEGEGKTHLEEGLSPLTRSRVGGGYSKEESRQSTVVGSKPQSVSVQSARVPTTAASSQGMAEGGDWEEEGEVGEAGEEMLSYVSGLLFNAVCEMVSRSHCQLCAGLWREGGQELVRGREEMGSTSLRGAGDLSRSFIDLGEQRTVSLRNLKPVDNPRAVLEDFSRRFHSHSSIPRVQIEAKILFSIPRIHMEPRLSDIHSEVSQVTSVLLSILHKLSWWAGPDAGRTFYSVYDASGATDHMQDMVLEAFRALEQDVDRCVSSLRLHDFLWREDMHATYQKFLESSPSQSDCCLNVERFMEVEEELSEVPEVFTVGPLHMLTGPVTHSLSALAVAWKLEFASFLHKQAQSSLAAMVEQREAMRTTLQRSVETLPQLRDTLQLLLTISDLQNTIDEQYLPVERMYDLLRRYTPSLPRDQVHMVDSLREEWEALSRLAEQVRHHLLHEQRHIHEREVEKQVRAFHVETIQFRNSFDTEGPLVPGLAPEVAMERLGSFLKQCGDMQSKRELFSSVQRLLSLPPTLYPELEQTESDLFFLQALHSSYQDFLTFDKRFRQTLWQEVDLEEAERTLEAIWTASCSLPAEQQEWETTRKLQINICHYQDLLPLLRKLHSKVIRNRHWLQVMSVTNCTFQLEGTLFKLTHILEADLPQHSSEIEQIVYCAQKEQELESQFRSIEEEWNEQVLHFIVYKSLGEVLLDRDHTHFLLDQLDHAGAELAKMLVSRHVSLLREEVTQWASRLARVGDVLQQWLSVQTLWQSLEAVFSDYSTARQFRDETQRFAAVHTSWVSLMTTARDTPGVVQCCDGEVSRTEVLAELREKLEQCKKSLSLYLLSKRQVFPRLFFVSDDALLQILSTPDTISSLLPHLSSLFTAIRSITTQPPEKGGDPVIITAVESIEGEQLQLANPVPLSGGVEVWASLLLSSSCSSLSRLLSLSLASSGTSSVEELAHHQVAQVASMTLYLQWTHNTEIALSQCRYDRRALPGMRSKFGTAVVTKLSNLIMRRSWRRGGEAITAVERLKLEGMAMLAVWLRDILDDLCTHKLRDTSDFEWQRFLRPYITMETDGQQQLQLHCLHKQLPYGYEYQGCHALPVLTPRMNNYIIALTQGMDCGLNSLLYGPHDSGKQETVKGVAQLLGRFLLCYPCTALTCPHTLSRLFEGLAQDGVWACLSDVDSLPPPVLCVVSHMVEAVCTAVRAGRNTCRLLSGREMVVKPGVTIMLTSSSLSWKLPPSMAALFRTFSLPPLDPAVTLQAYCTSLGLRAPRVLASKLSTLYRMTNEQLSSPLTLSSLCQVLTVASQRSEQLKAVASPQHRSEAGRETGGLEEHHSHRHVTMAAAKESHRGQKLTSLVVTPPTPHPIPSSAVQEHSSLAQLLTTLTGPRFTDQELPVFLSLVRAAFGLDHSFPLSVRLEVGGASDPLATPTNVECVGNEMMDEVLIKKAKEAGLVATETWLAKVKELLVILQFTNRHVVIAGRPATGKTVALKMTISALNSSEGQRSKVNMHRVYPGAFDNLSTLIGQPTSSGGWVDGVCTTLIRKALKTPLAETWVCLDGDPSHSWLHPLTELMSTTQTLCLPHGERLEMKGSGLKLIFETGPLRDASPALLTSCGVVYFGAGVLSWQPLVGAWLSSRRQVERGCLEEQFATLMEPVVELVCRQPSSLHSEVGLTETCLAYLSSLLNTYAETAESFSAIHVVRLLVFSIIWSYGAILQTEEERGRFGRLLKSLTNCLPDDDTHYCVFDYYVDESGEWDVWQTRIPLQPVASSQVDLLGRVYVDTPDTVRAEVLLDLALSSGRHVLLTGPHGSGKTTVCRHFLQGRVVGRVHSEVVSQLVLDGHTSCSSLHRVMEVSLHHRQGHTYGPHNDKSLHLFIDDLHLPQHPSSSSSSSSSSAYPYASCHEYIRQLIDGGGLWNLSRPNCWSVVEDLTVFAALTADGKTTIPPRLQRLFAVVQLPELSHAHLQSIVSEMLRTLCAGIEVGQGAGLSGEVHRHVVQSSVELYSRVKEALRASDTPGREHYVFSLSQLESAFQGLYHCLSSPSSPGLAYCWSHEMSRSLSNRVSHSLDHRWLQGVVHSLAEKLHGGLPDRPPLTLSSVPPEIKQGEEQPSFTCSPLNCLPEVELHPLTQWDDLEVSLQLFLMRCRQEWGEFPLTLSTNHIQCLLRLHRALKFPHGNSILVGQHGQQLDSIARFSLYMSGYQLRQVDCSCTLTFRSSLRALYRRAGLEGKPVAAIITEEDLKDVEMVQFLNGLVATGELPTLFSNDEMEGILQALAPSIKKDFPSEEAHPMHYLTGRIYRNLRLVLCVTPTWPPLGPQACSFKGLLSGSHLIWMTSWSEEDLSHSIQHYFSTSSHDLPLHSSLRSSLYSSLSAIHHHVLKETGQLLPAGQRPTSSPSPSRSSSSSPSADDSDPLCPVTLRILMEKVLDLDQEIGQRDGSRETTGKFSLPYVGPLTFNRFLECFSEIYSRKNTEAKAEKEHLEKALQTLQSTSHEVGVMRDTLTSLQKDYSETAQLCSSLLHQLRDKSCQVERLKALLGLSSSVMNAIQMTAEQERAMADDLEDSEELLSAVGGGVGRRSSQLEAQLEKTKELLLTVEAEEREAKAAMIRAREKVTHIQDKIDRNTVDQIKSLPSPPAVVCTVMEVILTLLQQHGRGGGASGVGVALSGESVQSGSDFSQRSEAQPHDRRPALLPHSGSDKTNWAAIKLAIGDSQHFLDLLSSLHWEGGVSMEAVRLISSRLAVPKTHTSSHATHDLSVSATSDSTSSGQITMAMAKHASEEVGVMWGFAVGVVEYTHVHQSHSVVVEKLRRVHEQVSELLSAIEGGGGGGRSLSLEASELAEVREEEENEIGEESLHKLEEEMKVLQDQFNKAAVKKHSLDQACQQLSERLKSVSHLMESLQSRQRAWQDRLDHAPPPDHLLANCVLAAAVTTYCGPFKTRTRCQLFEAMSRLCRENGLPREPDSSALSLSQYPQFMMGKSALYQLVTEGLPHDITSQQNACIITQSPAHSWPLISDPQELAIVWLQQREKDVTIISHQSPKLHSLLLSALTAGSHLIVTDVEGEGVTGDEVMMDILQCSGQLRLVGESHNIKIGGKEIECSSNFRLTLVTPTLPHALPSKLVAMVTVVLCWPEPEGLQGLLLDQFLWKQNAKTGQERVQLRMDLHKHCQKVEEVEGQLLQLLSRETQLEDTRVTRDLLQLNTAYEDAVESLNQSATHLQTMTKVQLSSLSALSLRASLISSVVLAMGSHNSLYSTSYRHLQHIFLTIFERLGSHLQGDDAVDKFTHAVYSHFAQGYFEKDKLLFSFVLVLQIKLKERETTREEVQYLLNPTPGTKFAIKGLAAQAGWDLPDAVSIHFGKKPYDWMSDTQWQNSLMLASRFTWCQRGLDRSVKGDTREIVFRMITESKHPEFFITHMPEHEDALMKRLGVDRIQRVLYTVTIRPDRWTFALQSVCEAVLAHANRTYESPVEMSQVVKGWRKRGIALIIFRDDPHIPLSDIKAQATRLNVPLTVCTLHGTGEREVESVKKAFSLTSSTGGWLLLHNIQASPLLLSCLPALLEDYPTTERWRLWLTVSAGGEVRLPVRVQNSVCRLVLESPQSIKGSLLHTLHSLGNDIISCSSRLEWLPLLHTAALLFATLRARGTIYQHSWSCSFQPRHAHMLDVMGYLQRMFRESEATVGGAKPIPWSGIRYMMSEVFYGSSITDPTDLHTLSSIVEHWIHPGGPRREPGIYHTPSLFLTPGSRLSALCQAVESAMPPASLTAELCGLHATPQMKLGWLEYLLPSISSLFSFLDLHVPFSSSGGQDHAPFLCPPRDRQEAHRLHHQQITYTHCLEKLPSWVQIPNQLMELNLTSVPIPILQEIGSNVSVLRQLPLEATVRKLLDVIPAGWKQDVLSEKLSRHASSPSFLHFLRRETSAMNTSLHTLHSSLLSLLHTLDKHSTGDTLTHSPHLTQLTLSLLTLSVPCLWLETVGPSAPPPHWPLREWVQDLGLRFVFLDQVLSNGLAKVPTYWLGAFFHPEAFLSVIKQMVLDSQCRSSGGTEEVFFLAEVTSRNKDHIRDPPPEGELFVFGAHLWGCSLERSASMEFQDVSPKHQSSTPLPLLHLALSTRIPEQTGRQGKGVEPKNNMTYWCPCFTTYRAREEGGGGERDGGGREKAVAFRLLVHNQEVTPLKWATRNLACTLRPF